MGRYSMLIIFSLFISVYYLRIHTRSMVQSGVTNYATAYKQKCARNIANSGANIALNALTVNVEETESKQNIGVENGSFSYFIERQAQDTLLGPTQVRVTSIGRYVNEVDTVIVLLTRPSFSRYAYFTNQEGNIWFQTGDTLRGPVHTNTYFQMQGFPVFYGKVTSHSVYSASNPYRPYTSGTTSPSFLGGSEWKVPYLPMPSSIPDDLVEAAQSGGIYIAKRYAWLKFRADGCVEIAAKNVNTTPTTAEYVVYNLANTNGVIYITYTSTPIAQVKGTVNGQVTVGCSGTIKVTGDLLCADDPRTNINSNDMIGLTAVKDINITANVADADRTVQASCMTLNTTVSSTTNFWVEEYNSKRFGVLHLDGALVQQARGAVGQIGSYGTRTGYLKDYRWDPRLKWMTPPHFPMLFVLRKIAWWD
jgi:hypothetical protein